MLLGLVVIEEADGDAEIPFTVRSAVDAHAVLRLRRAIRFAQRQTPLRMTGGQTT
jgi:hypothetical protein